MLIASEQILDRRNAIVGDKNPGEWTEEQIRALIEADPEDYLPLAQWAELKIVAEEYEEAEDYLWRALRLEPCNWILFRSLSYVAAQRGKQMLSRGLTALELFYVSQDRSAAEMVARTPRFKEVEPKLRKLAGGRRASATQLVGVLYRTFNTFSDSESPEDAEALRGYRMVRDLFETKRLDAGFVDSVLSGREWAGPFLVGVLRAWARTSVYNEAPVGKAVALLGELGDLRYLRPVVEIAAVDNPEITGAATWAFNRMMELGGEAFDQAVLEIAADARTVENFVLMKAATYHHRHWPVSFQVLDHLVSRVGCYKAADRNAICSALVMALMTVKQREGVEQARKLLRENAAVLSREARAKCDSMIAELGGGPFPKLPAPKRSPVTIYEICSGEVALGEDEPGDELDDYDSFEPPEPVQRPRRPGRNEPCWCGSGKKYKKCHLDADEHGGLSDAPAETGGRTDGPDIGRLRRQLIAFRDREVRTSEHREIRDILFAPGETDQDAVMVGEWTLHDWVAPRFGRTLIQEYLRRSHATLSQAEQDLLHRWASSYYGLYEVTDVRKGVGLMLRDMTSGESRFVHDVSASQRMVRWDGMLARILDGERGLELAGFVLVVARQYLDSLFAWMEREKRQLRLPWPEYLKTRFPQIRRQVMRLYREGLSALEIRNSDGEEFVASTATYRVDDAEALLAALRANQALVEDEDGVRFSWLDPRLTVFGTISIDGPTLAMECNSKERLIKGKQFLAEIAGSSIRHERDDFTSGDEMKARVLSGEAPPPPEDAGVPPDAAHAIISDYLKRHYASWPDQKLPALDNRTPREAMQDRLLRPRVIELLRQFENAEERKRVEGEPYFDVAPLMDELGVKEHERR